LTSVRIGSIHKLNEYSNEQILMSFSWRTLAALSRSVSMATVSVRHRIFANHDMHVAMETHSANVSAFASVDSAEAFDLHKKLFILVSACVAYYAVHIRLDGCFRAPFALSLFFYRHLYRPDLTVSLILRHWWLRFCKLTVINSQKLFIVAILILYWPFQSLKISSLSQARWRPWLDLVFDLQVRK